LRQVSSKPDSPASGAEESWVPRPSRDAAWQEIDGEMVVLDARRKLLRGLNRVGGMVWSLIDGQRSAGEIARLVCASTREPEARVRTDVLAFLTTLRALGLIEALESETL
jgi:hypothetical protein